MKINKMKVEERKKIEEISKDFAKPFKKTVGEIAGSGWLIVDPLSGYLNFSGFKNTLKEIAKTDTSPQILIMVFSDGDVFVPAGSDFKKEGAKDWMWID